VVNPLDQPLFSAFDLPSPLQSAVVETLVARALVTLDVPRSLTASISEKENAIAQAQKAAELAALPFTPPINVYQVLLCMYV
jgi:hypothetical protein